MKQIVLASASPRRRELLAQIGIADPIISPADADESVFDGLPPEETVVALARLKAETAAKNFQNGEIVIGSDTVVEIDGRILGKPRDRAHAEEMISALSGREHRVLTGLCVVCGDRIITGLGAATVRFRELSEDEIKGYCATSEPYDKAGAYAIQGGAGIFAESIGGDYYSIVGLPLCQLSKILVDLGYKFF